MCMLLYASSLELKPPTYLGGFIPSTPPWGGELNSVVSFLIFSPVEVSRPRLSRLKCCPFAVHENVEVFSELMLHCHNGLNEDKLSFVYRNPVVCLSKPASLGHQ